MSRRSPVEAPKRSFVAGSLRFLSLLVTPWAIFVSSSVSLYLLNQDSLNYNTSVLLPFLGATALGVLLGYGILYDSEKNDHFPAAPWLFYLAGPAFMVWNTVDGHLQGAPWHLVWLLIVFCAWLALGLALRPRDTRLVAPFFGVFAVLIIAADVYAFATQGESGESYVQENTRTEPPSQASDFGEPNRDLPNIYHVVLDGYQSNILEMTLDDASRHALSGFRFYPRNIGLHANTAISIPSVFAGRPWRGKVGLSDFTGQAYASPESLLQQLKDIGYHTTAYLHQEVAFGVDEYDKVFFHHEFASEKPWSDRAFLWAWLYAYWPEVAIRYLLGDGVIDRIEAGDLSPRGYAVGSLDTFEAFLDREARRSSNGHYTFLHLIVPHPPYVLSAGCEPREKVAELEQYRCANRVIVNLVSLLKDQDKFVDSLIIIHADHGDDLDVDGLLIRQVPHEPNDIGFLKIRSSTLLLYKPPGVPATGELIIDQAPTSLLDVAPTVLSSVGATVPDEYEGRPLEQTGARSEHRAYYVHDGRFLYRYSISGENWGTEPAATTRTPVGE